MRYTVKTKVIRHNDLSKAQSEIDAATNEISANGCIIHHSITYEDYKTVIKYLQPIKPEYELLVEAIERIEVKVTLEKGERLYIKLN